MITLFRIATFLAAFISTVLSVYVYTKRERSMALRFLSGLMIANMVYATSYLFEISAPTRSELIFFLNLEYVGITFIPIFWVLIAWYYKPVVAKSDNLQLQKARLLYCIPAAAILFIWTNPWHRLMYKSIDMDASMPITLLLVDRAIGFWVVNGLMILLFLIGMINIILNFIHVKETHRKEYLVLALSSLPPFASYMLVLTKSVPYNLDTNPIAFALSGLMIFWGIKSMQLFNLVAIAEHMVVDAMHDAMIVLDNEGHIIETNRQACVLFGKDPSTLIGLSIDLLNPELSSMFSSSRTDADLELNLPDSGQIRSFTVNLSPIEDRRGRVKGHLFLLHDITDVRSYVKELEMLASSDGLTKLLNHRTFMQQAQKEAERLRSAGTGQFSLIMFDLDHFKSINDTYGHTAGDAILQQIGQLVSSQTRSQDICARYGGEEFIMLLTDTPLDTAVDVAESLCRNIQDGRFFFEEKQITITASFGVSIFNVESNLAWNSALSQADTALYMAKDAGRNQVKVVRQ